MTLKFISLILPLLIFIIFRYLKINLKKRNKTEKIIKCEICNTFVHESLIVNKHQKNYCSEECSSL